MKLTIGEAYYTINARLSQAAPRLVPLSGSGAVQGPRAMAAPSMVRLHAGNQPEQPVGLYALDFPDTSNRGLTREGEQGGGVMLRDTVLLTITYPMSMADPEASRLALIELEELALGLLIDPVWSRVLRLTYQGTRRTFASPGQGAHSSAALTFIFDRQFITGESNG